MLLSITYTLIVLIQYCRLLNNQNKTPSPPLTNDTNLRYKNTLLDVCRILILHTKNGFEYEERTSWAQIPFGFGVSNLFR